MGSLNTNFLLKLMDHQEKRGRPKRTKKDMDRSSKGLEEQLFDDLAKDRLKWRNKIHVIDSNLVEIRRQALMMMKECCMYREEIDKRQA